MTDKTEKAVGLYSASAAELFGTVLWTDAAGKEYEITAYDYPSSYKWPDAVFVADVVEFSRMGSEGFYPRHCR